jgi:hypothetical protein
LSLLLAVLSLLGGLFTSLSSFAAIIVAKLTHSQFITTVTKNLYLVKKFQPATAENTARVEDQANSDFKLSPEGFEKYSSLKESLKSGKVQSEHINHITDEIGN